MQFVRKTKVKLAGFSCSIVVPSQSHNSMHGYYLCAAATNDYEFCTMMTLHYHYFNRGLCYSCSNKMSHFTFVLSVLYKLMLVKHKFY